MDVAALFNVNLRGSPQSRPLMFAHGFGCDQHMWSLVAPAFEADYRVVLFDLAGVGHSDPSSYDRERHSTLTGYAEDVVTICRELGLTDVVYVGHSVSAMIGVLAHNLAPELFASLVLVGPSPRYIDAEGYRGGFSSADIAELLQSLESNYLGWSAAMAPAIMGNPDRPELGQTLTESFCQADPEIARRFAGVTFGSDNRADLSRVSVPTLVMQCSDDIIAPVEVGEYVRDAIPDATLVQLQATGHCPNLSAPEETIAVISDFLAQTAQH